MRPREVFATERKMVMPEDGSEMEVTTADDKRDQQRDQAKLAGDQNAKDCGKSKSRKDGTGPPAKRAAAQPSSRPCQLVWLYTGP